MSEAVLNTALMAPKQGITLTPGEKNIMSVNIPTFAYQTRTADENDIYSDVYKRQGYMCLKEKKIMDFFCDVVLWFMLLIGLILMLLPSEIFSSISQIQIVFPDAVNLVAKGLAIAGAVGILLMSGRDKKNPALRLALGAYDLYNITGWRCV